MADTTRVDSEEVWESSTVLEVLDAVEKLGEELSTRSAENEDFLVSVPQDPPSVKVLAELINELGKDISNKHEKLSLDMAKKNEELIQAYNTLQKQNENISQELLMARRVQERLLPGVTDFPGRSEFKCSGFYRSMQNVGGDLYDVYRVGRNSWASLIADVSGHGVPAALITALVKIAFRVKSRWGMMPDEICREVNAEILPMLLDLDMYVTVFFCLFDLEAKELRYTNCGHHPGLILPGAGDELVPIDTAGRFLGFFDDPGCATGVHKLEDGDLVFIYTDGILEARNFFEEEYGLDRLQTCLTRHGELEPEPLLKAVIRDLDGFTMGAEARDDQTMFAMSYHTVEGATLEPKDPGETPTKTSGRINPLTPILHEYGRALKERHFDEAAGILRALAALRPDSNILPLLEAGLLHSRGRGEEALRVLDIHAARLGSNPNLSDKARRLRDMIASKGSR